LVEKLAELGVARLIWLQTIHGQGRPPQAERTAAWAVGALEQSRGGWLMETSEALVAMDALPRPLLVAAPGGEPSPPRVRSATVAVGPEGGWAPDEIPTDATCIELGPTILRVETAAIVAATVLR
jgi:RsmE family RNA methyltransferase